MRVNYYSEMSEGNITRVAFISIDKEVDEKAYVDEMFNKMAMKAWYIEQDTEDSAICLVEDFEEYKYFMKDWNETKEELQS